MFSELTIPDYQQNIHGDQFNAETKRLANRRLMQSSDYSSANKENFENMDLDEKKKIIAQHAFKQTSVEKGSFFYLLSLRSLLHSIDIERWN